MRKGIECSNWEESIIERIARPPNFSCFERYQNPEAEFCWEPFWYQLRWTGKCTATSIRRLTWVVKAGTSLGNVDILRISSWGKVTHSFVSLSGSCLKFDVGYLRSWEDGEEGQCVGDSSMAKCLEGWKQAPCTPPAHPSVRYIANTTVQPRNTMTLASMYQSI